MVHKQRTYHTFIRVGLIGLLILNLMDEIIGVPIVSVASILNFLKRSLMYLITEDVFLCLLNLKPNKEIKLPHLASHSKIVIAQI